MTDETPTRPDAHRIAREDRAHTLALIARVSPAAFETPGLGDGEWSPKDLLGHLESWERYALDAVHAWDRGERAPIGEALEELGTDEVNRREVDRMAAIGAELIRASAAKTHADLLATIEAMDDEAWVGTPLAGEEHSRGDRIGGILGGPLGPFRHDTAHWDDLEGFALRYPA